MRFSGQAKGSGGIFAAVERKFYPTPLHPSPLPEPEPERPTRTERVMALLEVVMCSGYPTQFALAQTFTALGYGAFGADGSLDLHYVVYVSLSDTLLMLGLIALFLSVHHEHPRDLFIGVRSVVAEAIFGIPLIFLALTIGIVTIQLLRAVAPWLQTTPENPFQGLIEGVNDIVLFVILVFVAGGIREEVQRAFLLRRFERWLGGTTVGVVVTSLSFG